MTTQTVVIKPGKADQIAWDGSTMFYPMDIVMNQVTPVSCEAPITFGHVKIQLYIDIYNMRISHPTATILLGRHQSMLLFPTNPSRLDWGLWIYGRWLLQSGQGHGIWLYDVRV